MGHSMAYRFRIYPTTEQRTALAQAFGCARYVYNWGLEQRTRAYYDEGRSLSYTETAKMLTTLKREDDTRWLSDVSSVVLQQSLRNLEQAFQNFFDGRACYPNFKRKHSKQSARFASNAFTLRGKALTVAKVPGVLNVRWGRDLEGVPSSVTVSRDPAGRYFVSLTCEIEKEPLPTTNTSVGVDLGVTDLVVTSGGFKSGNPRHLDADLYRLRKAQRRLSKKQKGSQNYRKQRQRVARLHARIADKRKDFLHKLSRRIVDENQVIAFETLAVKHMQKNGSLARHIADASWSELVRQVQYKAEWAGRTVVQIDRWFPSSKRCSDCGYLSPKMPLDIRTWRCPDCGSIHDRDVNAAKNIRTVGLTGLALSENDCGGHSKTREAFGQSGHGPVKQ